jgi:hypothetical protein
MNKIKSQKDLLAQISYSRMRITQLEQLIKNDFEEIKEAWKPSNVAKDIFHDLLMSEKGGLMGATVGLTVDRLIRKLLMRKSNFITKMVVALLAKNYMRNLVSKKSDNIIDWVKSLFLKIKSKHGQNGYQYDESTAGVDWEN